MTKFKTMTTEAAKSTAARMRINDKRAERYARMCAFDIASATDYTEDEAYEAIMWKAKSLTKLAM